MRGQVIVIGAGLIGPCRDIGPTCAATTGRLITDVVTGQKPCVDPAPYRIDRF
jgi:hypothetical protein